MVLENVEQGFRVTDNPRFIASAALRTIVHEPLQEQQEHDALVDVFSRMMVVIQNGGLQAYFKKGFEYSCCARTPNEPNQVLAEKASLKLATEVFSQRIEGAGGKPASRIRANRARLMRAGYEWMQPVDPDNEEQFWAEQFEREAMAANQGHEPLVG